MYLIAGLGNPGNEYRDTRHNAGFIALDYIAHTTDADYVNFNNLAMIAKTRIYGENVILVKPSTYMNNSGIAIRGICDYYKIEKEEVIIIYDDIDLDECVLRIRKSGSAGTHNGMKSVVDHLQTEDFARVRIGVGRNGFDDLADYVLKAPKDMEKFVESCKSAAEAAIWIVRYGIAEAQSKYN